MRRLVTFLLHGPRALVQSASLLIFNSYFFQGLKGIPCLGFNCYACPAAVFACPIGSLQHFMIIRQVPFYLLGVLGLVGATVGRLSCGWLCPWGFFQEVVYKLPVPKWRVSARRLGWLRYSFLVVVAVIVAFATGAPWFCKICPAGALEAGIPWVIIDTSIRSLAGGFFALKMAILVGFLVWFAVSKRPFCRFVCPLGAIYSPFNRVSQLGLEFRPEACSDCGLCRDVCPVDIDVTKMPNSPECIRCMECVRSCPTMAIRLRGEY